MPQVDQARRTLDNTRQLQERNFVSQNALDQARSGFDVAVGNRDAVSAQLALARKALADAALVAPIDGIVAERFAQPGEKLPIDGRVLSIVDLSRMEIEAPVPAAEVGTVRIGQPVDLRVEGVAARQRGHVVRIAPSTQAGTRSVPVYIALDNRDPSVRAGLFAQGSLEVEARDGVLAVPLSAIRDAGARLFVYAVVDGRLVERDVRIGLRDESGGGPGIGGSARHIFAGGDGQGLPHRQSESGLDPGDAFGCFLAVELQHVYPRGGDGFAQQGIIGIDEQPHRGHVSGGAAAQRRSIGQ